jgi:hypothetical protein
LAPDSHLPGVSNQRRDRRISLTDVDDTQWLALWHRLFVIRSLTGKVINRPSIAEVDCSLHGCAVITVVAGWSLRAVGRLVLAGSRPVSSRESRTRDYMEGNMRSFHACGQTVAISLLAIGIGLATVPMASADPAGTDQPQPPAPIPGPPSGIATPDGPVASPEAASIPGAPLGPTGAPQGEDPSTAQPQSSGDPTKDACSLFNKAVNYAAVNYEDFADYSAGGGNYVDYSSSTVNNANVAGRTALRQAASASLAASTIPGASPEVTAPMQAWSLSAAKMVLVMGVRGGGDTLNSTATDMNKQAHDAQIACATAQMSQNQS